MQILPLNTFQPSKLNGGHHGSTSPASFSSASFFFLSLSSFFLLLDTDGPVFTVEAAFVAVPDVCAAPVVVFSG
jgi:hypothetical protein